MMFFFRNRRLSIKRTRNELGLSFEQLKPLKWGGEIPERVERAPMVLGENCVVDPPVVLSPMAAVTNPPFRQLCREMGAGLVVTEMIYARGLIHNDKKSTRLLDLRPEENPISVQIFGKEPDELARACEIVQKAGAHSVDLNMGCPMRKVVGSGHGAALLRDPEKVFEIFQAMSSSVDIPVTGKIRAGWEDSNAIEVAQAMEAGGAKGVTIHGRTRSDMYDGHADLNVIAELVRSVRIKVVGNGDISDYISARRMFSVTGCDAIMVARGALGNPWVFREIAADLRGEKIPDRPGVEDVREVVNRHVQLYIDSFGIEVTSRQIRKHLLWYFRDTPAEIVLRKALKNIETHVDILHAVEEAAKHFGPKEDGE